ncbi:Fungal transcriptional regulatory protein, N-terminal [Pleurostoma richardsiae]|uniref:Fungal transcriptional regulatory protein, N-terminal n=1 Tax=Pleurostoma richardsiae TaxID=41990 RepID=A0AA38VB56_9PEZI|nr:Fungal transcriptional regulatory protein, N-terminal [Pleurostoma richardsiae]
MRGTGTRSRVRPPKLKSVTFTGCWTCRSRKIKCDERRRNGCANFQGTRRRRIKPDQHASPVMSDDEVARIMSAIDAVSAPSTTVVMGPFAIFQSRLDNPIPASENPHSRPLAISSVLDETNTLDSLSRQHDLTWDILDSDVQTPSTIEPSTETECLLPYTENAESSGRFANEDAAATSAQTESSTSQPFGCDMMAEPQGDLLHIPSLHPGLSMPLFRDQQTALLMDYYMNHVAVLLQPVLHPRNPWRTTYFPFALEGCPDLFLCQTSSSPSSHASTSLFHSLLSAAAFHLRNATGGSTDFHRLGLQHRIKALRALKAVPIQTRDPQPYAVYLTAMLSLVTIDTMTGEDSDYPIHLRGCRYLEPPVRQLGRPGNASSPVSSICHFLTLLAQTTAHEIEPRPWPTRGPGFDPLCFSSDERSIEHIYGITPALGNLLQKTCQIAEHLVFYRRGGENIPISLRMACRAIEHELEARATQPEPFRLIRCDEQPMYQIAQCQARAFHGAVRLFYYRSIQREIEDGEDDGTMVVSDVEAQVRAIWKDLTEAEDLKDANMGGVKRAAPMSWPGFVAACEAVDREPWAKWWERVQGYHMGNLARQWRIIREVWAVMDSDRGTMWWKDALRLTGQLVLPI